MSVFLGRGGAGDVNPRAKSRREALVGVERVAPASDVRIDLENLADDGSTQ